jgi:nitroimidazol reductase NimA-like FMN-containing flavoprotein (pyridoxamine 5'-phosphate oxidase superfamily)
MLIHELSAEECAEIFTRAHLGRLGCAHNGQPYIVPISFSFDVERRCFYCFSLAGQKIAWMRENPKVCIEAEEIADKNRWTSVLAFGRYQEIGDSPADRDTRRRAQQLLEQRSEWWLPGAAKADSHEHHEMVLYRIDVDRLTGRRAVRDRG